MQPEAATPAPAARLGLVLVVSGPSGVGKSTIVRQVLAADPGLGFSVSCTTRAPRPREVDGREYWFVREEEFVARVAAGAFLEHAQVHGHRYGTLKAEVYDRLRAGRDVLLDIDVQGARQVRAQLADPLLARCARFVFLGPPSLAELERRLRGRATEAEEVVVRRLAVARDELAAWRVYDYLVINADIDATVAAVRAIVASERLAISRLPDPPPWG